MTNMDGENQGINQPPANSSKKPPILLIVGIIVVLCIGAIAVILIMGGGTFDFKIGGTEPKYTNETIGSFTFRIPEGYEKMKEDVAGMVEFKNDTNKFIRIESADKKYDLYTWSLAVSSVIGGVRGDKVDLNGTGAYRFETEDIMVGGTSDQTIYVYALNLGGKSYIIILSKGIEEPNEFLTNMTKTE